MISDTPGYLRKTLLEGPRMTMHTQRKEKKEGRFLQTLPPFLGFKGGKCGDTMEWMVLDGTFSAHVLVSVPWR